MAKYFFNFSGRREFLSLVNFLSEKNIAQPSLLYGDDRLYAEFDVLYPGLVLREKSFYDDLSSFDDIEYSEEFSGFFSDQGFLKYKDQILKMMDRMDHIGTFNRLDRESLIYRLTTFWFEKIKLLKPDVLIFCDAPHTHETFSLFYIGKYLNIPILLIRQWSIFPCIYLTTIVGQHESVVKRFKPEISDQVVFKYMNAYFQKISNRNENLKYEPIYLAQQRNKTGLSIHFIFKRIGEYFYQGQISKLLLKILLVSKNSIIKKIQPIFDDLTFKRYFYHDFKNQINISNWSIKKIISNRRNRLIRKYLMLSNTLSLKELSSCDFVYYAMHYEPECSTNPEGNDFYDQFIALVALRDWIPKNIKIVIKEHPSQFYKYSGASGYLGRSGFFYDAVNDLKNVSFVRVEQESFDLIKNSLFVVTITGTVAIEAALTGKKAVYFGDPWFKGLPNTYNWSLYSYSELVNKNIASPKEAQDFIFKRYQDSCYPVMLNPSSLSRYPEVADSQIFRANEITSLCVAVKNSLENIFNKKLSNVNE